MFLLLFYLGFWFSLSCGLFFFGGGIVGCLFLKEGIAFFCKPALKYTNIFSFNYFLSGRKSFFSSQIFCFLDLQVCSLREYCIFSSHEKCKIRHWRKKTSAKNLTMQKKKINK